MTEPTENDLTEGQKAILEAEVNGFLKQAFREMELSDEYDDFPTHPNDPEQPWRDPY